LGRSRPAEFQLDLHSQSVPTDRRPLTARKGSVTTDRAPARVRTGVGLDRPDFSSSSKGVGHDRPSSSSSSKGVGHDRPSSSSSSTVSGDRVPSKQNGAPEPETQKGAHSLASDSEFLGLRGGHYWRRGARGGEHGAHFSASFTLTKGRIVTRRKLHPTEKAALESAAFSIFEVQSRRAYY